MKTEYLYAILDADGKCWRIVPGGNAKVNLTDLLDEGWRPLRETPYAPAVGTAYVLIVLEREVEGSFGFGFSPKSA